MYGCVRLESAIGDFLVRVKFLNATLILFGMVSLQFHVIDMINVAHLALFALLVTLVFAASRRSHPLEHLVMRSPRSQSGRVRQQRRRVEVERVRHHNGALGHPALLPLVHALELAHVVELRHPRVRRHPLLLPSCPQLSPSASLLENI